MTGGGGRAYDELDELYDLWCAGVVEDVPFYLGLAAALSGELGKGRLDVVELGAGSGRITLPLLGAGHRVTAIDASHHQLDRLADAVGEHESLRLVHGDMRELSALVEAAHADLVIAPFRSLLHVTADRDAVLGAAHRVLRPGGALAFDVFHATPDQVQAVNGHWIHRRVQRTQRGKWRFDERATYRPAPAGDPGDESLLDVDVRCRWTPLRRPVRRLDPELPADPADDAHERTATLQLRLTSADAWRSSIELAGFEVDGAYGWFDARPLAPDDDDSIWVARRR